MKNKNEIAIFGGGCFWYTETIFLQLKGVKNVMSGYVDGITKKPSYEQVCSDNQKKIAEEFIETLNKSGEFTNRIVTELKPLETFYPAENYYQDFYTKNYGQPYCQLVISPKLTRLREQYSNKLK